MRFTFHLKNNCVFNTVRSEMRILCAVNSNGPHESKVSEVKIKVSPETWSQNPSLLRQPRVNISVQCTCLSRQRFPLKVHYGVGLYKLVPGLLSLNTGGGVYRDLSLNCQRHLVFVE